MAVGIDVGNEGGKVIGILVRVKVFRWINWEPLGEAGAGIPERPVDGIPLAVTVDVTNAGCLGVEAVGQHDLLKLDVSGGKVTIAYDRQQDQESEMGTGNEHHVRTSAFKRTTSGEQGRNL